MSVLGFLFCFVFVFKGFLLLFCHQEHLKSSFSKNVLGRTGTEQEDWEWMNINTLKWL